MAQKKRKRTRKKQDEQYPGWMWMLFGLAVGLSVAFAIYMKDRPAIVPPQPVAQQPASLSLPMQPEPEPDTEDVQDEFQDLIRLGDGDEVAAVVHPAAPRSEVVYDFRLADSVTIEFQGDQDPVRVYELEVRPKDFTAPGLVGSVFLDQRDGAIVRMTFTFTSASYVDDYLDYIRISLDNSLWDGRYWLPYQQQVELRREMPYLDFAAGSVIRGHYQIRGYRFNEQLPSVLFMGGPVSAVPEDQRRAFPFEDDLYAQLDEEGLSPLPDLADVRREAMQLAGRRYLSGLGRLRLWAENGSSVLRANRVEGSVVGLGLAFRPLEGVRLTTGGGYSFGRSELTGSVHASWAQGRAELAATGVLNEPRTLDPFEWPAAP